MYVYVDTAALIALVYKRDALHQPAVSMYTDLLQQNARFLTTSAVLLEIGNTFSCAFHKVYATSVFQLVHNSISWDTIFIDEAWFLKGLDLLHKRLDKDWSVTDCIGMVAAEFNAITTVFTSDHHFEQAGFEILLPVKQKG